MRYVFAFIFFLIINNSFSQSRESKFVNDYIKYLSEDNEELKNDTYHFQLKYKITKERFDYKKNDEVNKLNTWLYTLGSQKTIKYGDLDISWNRNEISWNQKFRRIRKFQKDEIGCTHINYFKITKPIFYKDYALFICRFGTNFGHQSSTYCLYEWNEKTGEIIELKNKIFSISSPCFR